MQPLEQLLAALDAFEKSASPADKKAAVAPLQQLSTKLKIRSTELLQQRLMLTAAEGSRDKAALRDLNAHSQFPEIVEWSFSLLHPKPRTSGGLGFAVN